MRSALRSYAGENTINPKFGVLACIIKTKTWLSSPLKIWEVRSVLNISKPSLNTSPTTPRGLTLSWTGRKAPSGTKNSRRLIAHSSSRDYWIRWTVRLSKLPLSTIYFYRIGFYRPTIISHVFRRTNKNSTRFNSTMFVASLICTSARILILHWLERFPRTTRTTRLSHGGNSLGRWASVSKKLRKTWRIWMIRRSQWPLEQQLSMKDTSCVSICLQIPKSRSTLSK